MELVEAEEAKAVALERKADEMNAKMARDQEEIEALKEEFGNAFESMAQFREMFDKVGLKTEVKAED